MVWWLKKHRLDKRKVPIGLICIRFPHKTVSIGIFLLSKRCLLVNSFRQKNKRPAPFWALRLRFWRVLGESLASCGRFWLHFPQSPERLPETSKGPPRSRKDAEIAPEGGRTAPRNLQRRLKKEPLICDMLLTI